MEILYIILALIIGTAAGVGIAHFSAKRNRPIDPEELRPQWEETNERQRQLAERLHHQ